jgi:hypothetical protein
MRGSRIALGIRRLRRRSRRKERLRSLLLSTARDFPTLAARFRSFPVLAGVELAPSIFLSRLALNPLFSLGG